MKKLITAIFAGALLATSPAWADGGHGHRHGHGHGKHAEKEWKKAHKHWAKHHRHDDVVVYRQVVAGPAVVQERYYYTPQPVVVQPQPAPGVHVVMPNVYIPF